MTKCILDYLHQCVKEHPKKQAIAYKEHYVTFEALAERAQKYGYAITKALPDNNMPNPVGVFCSRDVDPIIAFFGVVYSKNFYVPLDPNAPTAKLQAIVKDSDMKVIIGSAENDQLIREINFTGSFITHEMVNAQSSEFMYDITSISEISEDYPLYMIYTSGSTGKPKGVLKSHKAEISYIEAFCDTFDFNEDDIIGNQTPFFFDAAAKDIYLMLKLGITMDIIPTEYFPLPPELIQYLNRKKITIASWVPTVLSIVAQLNPFSVIKPETLRRIFFVGEVMPMKHLNKWREAMPNIQYVNLYGQSELCGVCCYYEVKRTFANDESLPMGIPLKNCKIYLPPIVK